MPSKQTPHDAVAYPSFSHPDTHPEHLAAMAILHGLSPVPAERCRVLEIACNEGGNLIPMAYGLPLSEFVGFDLARLPIERGQARIAALGLANVRIFEGNILDVGTELGQFDYIVAHGFYAWVPEPVRDRMMELLGELLTPDGLAFVSYNAMPGGHIRAMMREIMLFGSAEGGDAEDRVAGARERLDLVIQARPEGDPFRALIEKQLARMEKRSAQSIYHDELTEAYHPTYFTDFAAHAERHGLQFLCEAVLPPPNDPCYRSELWPALEKASGGEFLKQEQLLDFARVRMYRETVLCRAGRAVRRDLPVEQLGKLLLASPVISGPGETAGAREFTLPGGLKTETNHPVVLSLLDVLEAAWPMPLSFEEIAARMGSGGFALDGQGATLLVRLAVSKLVEFHTARPRVAPEISARPRASACSRQEARMRPWAATLLHTTMGLHDPPVRSLLLLLDGTRTHRELVEALIAEFPGTAAGEIEAGVKAGLGIFYRAGLLEA